MKSLAHVFAPLLGLFGVAILFAIMTGAPERYLSAANLRVVLAQTVIVAIGALGMTLIIISGGIDLSVGSVVALASVITAVALRSGWPPIAAVLAGVITGGIIGCINGIVITTLRVVPFIATLGMLGVARGLAKYFANQQTVNEAAARACGINTARLKIWIYGVAGLIFGLAGVTQMSRLRQGDPTVAVGVELDVIAAVVIGGGSLSGGEGSIPGAMIGALVMSLLRNGCQQMGWANYVQEIIIGMIIVVAVAADRFRASRAAERSE